MAKILIVDDDPMIVKIMSIVLGKSGHAVSTAGNGALALAALGVRPPAAGVDLPDVILLDMIMPVMDGFTAAEEMARDSRVGKIPIIVITTKYEMRARFEALPQVVGFFLKPINPQALREAVDRAAPPK